MATDKWTDSSSNWDTLADWSGGVPTATSNVVVAEGDPQITSPISIASLNDSAQVSFSDAGASTIAGALTNTGNLYVDANYANGGSTLTISGVLTNSGSLDIGNGNLSAASTVTAASLVDFVGADVGTINLDGNTTTRATLDITGAAGFGATGSLCGSVNLSGDALLEFASGQITKIAGNSELTLWGPDVFVADASNKSANSALTGLATIAGNLYLNDIAPLTLSGALSNSGNLNVNAGYGAGGSALTISGVLTNTGSVNIGNGAMSAATTVTATGLVDFVGTTLGAINLIGNSSASSGGPYLATLDITGAAGFGAASVLTGSVNLSGDALLEFASGQITKIAGNSELTLSGPDAFVADASNTLANSALTGLATIAGNLYLNDIAPLTLSGALSNSGNLNVNAGYGDGGSALTISGVLTNSGSLNIGNGAMSAATTVTATGLVDFVGTTLGAINLIGNTSGAPVPVSATLDITGAAGFGAASVLVGSVNLSGNANGHALLEFASGQITKIVANSELTLSGPDAFVADASSTSANSALTGLATIAGSLNLNDIAPLTLSGALGNSGNLNVDQSYGDGGSTLTISGVLTNTGSVNIGNGALSAATTVTTTGLVDFVGTTLGTINLTGNTSGATIPVSATLDITGAAGFGAASVLVGSVNLSGNANGHALLEFASGEITKIAGNSELTLSGPDAFVADASNTSANSALTGLATIAGAGGLDLDYGASVTTSGALSNSGGLTVDNSYGRGGSALTISGVLTNSGSLDIGNGALSAATTVTAKGLGNTGTINLTGNTSGAPVPVSATLDITSAAGFGAASVLTGSVNLSGNANGHALLEFASGEITKIAGNSELTLSGPDAFVADASNTSANSALTGLATIAGAGGLDLEYSASVTTSGALSNSGGLSVDSSYGRGGSALTISGVLTNSGTANIGNGALSAATTVTAKGLNNTGTIYLSGNTSGAPAPVSATLDITGAAGFGAASVLTGSVNLSGNANGHALLEFASGQITKIAANSELTLSGPDAFVADASNTSANSALTGLATIAGAGGLYLEYGASVTTSGALSNSGGLSVDSSYGRGGSALTISGVLTNSGTANIGNSALSAATTVTAKGLNNTGTIYLSGNNSVSSGPYLATLDITGAAGFGAASVLTGSVNLSGDALLEFASGQITKIAANSKLTLTGPDAFVADASNTSANSALTGLATIAGSLNLNDIAPLTLSGALSNSGSLNVDASYGDGGSTLTISGVLTNSGSANIGNTSLSASTTVTVSGLSDSGAITLTGNGAAAAQLNITTGVSTVAKGGTLTLANDGGVTTVGAFNNSGTISISHTAGSVGSTLKIGGKLTNNGSVSLGFNTGSSGGNDSVYAASVDDTGGVINLSGASTTQYAILRTTGTSTASLGASAGLLSGAVSLSGFSQIQFAGGGEISQIGTNSSLTLTGGSAQLDDLGVGGNSALTGLSNIVGSLYLDAGAALADTAALSIGGALDLDYYAGQGGSSFTDTNPLVNSGVLDIGNATLSASDKVSASTLTNTGAINLVGHGAAHASLISSGQFTNNGAVSITADTEEIAGAVVGAGTFDLFGTSTLEFDGAVAAGEKVTFHAADRLALKSAGGFAATISGFGTADTIDAISLLKGSATYNFVENAGNTGGTLSLSDGTHSAQLLLSGSYTNASFQLAADSGTGTLIKFV